MAEVNGYQADHEPSTLLDKSHVRILHRPIEPRHGVVLYGHVPSSRDPARWYWVKKRRTGKGRFAYSCTCEGSFLGGHLCRHIAQFKLAEIC
jgi:hypothetical protein